MLHHFCNIVYAWLSDNHNKFFDCFIYGFVVYLLFFVIFYLASHIYSKFGLFSSNKLVYHSSMCIISMITLNNLGDISFILLYDIYLQKKELVRKGARRLSCNIQVLFRWQMRSMVQAPGILCYFMEGFEIEMRKFDWLCPQFKEYFSIFTSKQ